MLKERYLLRNVCGDYFLVDVGQKERTYKAPLLLNQTGAFICERLLSECDLDTISRDMAEEYDLPLDISLRDAKKFVMQIEDWMQS